MMVLTRSELLRMISVSRAIAGGEVRALGQQLTGVAHGADGIADLVRNARGQTSERGELALLHPLGHEAGVFEKDEGRRGRARTERREMWLDQSRPVGRDEAGRGVIL